MFDQKFSQDQHGRILKALERGELKQFQKIAIPVNVTGFPSTGGTRGVFEVEGNALTTIPSIFDPVSPVSASNPKGSDNTAILQIAFNRADNPWLPFQAGPGAGALTPLSGICLSFRRFFVFVSTAGGPTGIVWLLVLKGVNLYGSGYSQVTGSYF